MHAMHHRMLRTKVGEINDNTKTRDSARLKRERKPFQRQSGCDIKLSIRKDCVPSFSVLTRSDLYSFLLHSRNRATLRGVASCLDLS